MQEIICVLDGSGSMASVADEAMNGFNQFLKDQSDIGEANITVVWFDNKIDFSYEGELSECPELDSWRVGGMTALYDAIGTAFSHVKDRFSAEKPEKVVLAIQTDGLENASKEYKCDQVKALIEEHQTKYGWDVIFMGAGLDAANQASSLGVLSGSTFVYDVNDTNNAFAATYSTAVASARQ